MTLDQLAEYTLRAYAKKCRLINRIPTPSQFEPMPNLVRALVSHLSFVSDPAVVAEPIVDLLIDYTNLLPTMPDGTFRTPVAPFFTPKLIHDAFFRFFEPQLDGNYQSLRDLLDKNSTFKGTLTPPLFHEKWNDELYAKYLAHTPLRALYESEIGVSIRDPIAVNAAIFATSGGGKTTLLAHWLLEYLEDPNHPAMVIIDPDGDFATEFEQLKHWQKHHDKLVVVNALSRPALNMWDMPKLDASARSEVLMLYAFLFSGEGMPLTAPQRTMLSHMVSVMIAKHAREKATLRDLFNLAQEDLGGFKNQRPPQSSSFWPFIAACSDTTQEYFANRFWGAHAKVSKDALLNRLDAIISDDVLMPMFMATENKLDLFDLLHNQKKIVLVSAKGLGLGRETFLRYIVLRCIQVAYARAKLNPRERHPILLWVDEAQDVLVSDHEAKVIADKTRKLGLFMRAFAHRYKTIPPDYTGSCRIKIVAEPDDRDLTDFVRELRCGEKLLKETSTATTLKYTYWRRGATAMRLMLPNRTTPEIFPAGLKMTYDELRPLAAERRKNLRAIPTATHDRPQPKSEDGPPPQDEKAKRW